jgi:hypothetical protein
VIALALAQRLRAAGLAWDPEPGDCFVVPDRDMDDRIFVLSDMTIEIRNLPEGRKLIGFNGTTEWALDSLDKDEAVWLPREDQLRDRIGASFRRLERVDGGYRVVTTDHGSFAGAHPEEAYGQALLGRLTSR